MEIPSERNPCTQHGCDFPAIWPPLAPCILHTFHPWTAGFLQGRPVRFEWAVHRGDECALCMRLPSLFNSVSLTVCVLQNPPATIEFYSLQYHGSFSNIVMLLQHRHLCQNNPPELVVSRVVLLHRLIFIHSPDNLRPCICAPGAERLQTVQSSVLFRRRLYTASHLYSPGLLRC